VRDQQAKLKEANDNISSYELEISHHNKRNAEKEELINSSSNHINLNKNLASNLADHNEPSEALLAILGAYEILFALKVEDTAGVGKISNTNDEKDGVNKDKDKKEQRKENKEGSK
jgi:hypothetical protein